MHDTIIQFNQTLALIEGYHSKTVYCAYVHHYLFLLNSCSSHQRPMKCPAEYIIIQCSTAFDIKQYNKTENNTTQFITEELSCDTIGSTNNVCDCLLKNKTFRFQSW